ncbi:MAG: DUF2891 domain-containing protein [Planctomycetaceae bacterium]
MTLDAHLAERIARLALDGIGRDYPNQIAHVMHADGDARPPRNLTPIFYGCYDWHSAVHSHWCLIRLLRCAPNGGEWREECVERLDAQFTADNAAGEVAYLSAAGRQGFERPYGLAWLLQLCAELREWDEAAAQEWADVLQPLEHIAANRFQDWLPKLTHPIRSGEHSQTAFAFGLALDWSRTTGDAAAESLLCERSLFYHRDDSDAPLHFEPSGHDFLSPALAEADLMRRVLPTGEFGNWLSAFLPGLPNDGSADWLPLEIVTDPTDGKLAHLYGLNLSRAWMLEGVAAGLPDGDSRVRSLTRTADRHRDAGLPAVTGEHYSVSHWLGSFAVYLLTRRNVRENRPAS